MNMNYNKDNLGTDIEVVITSFNQGSMILEAVHSLCTQTSLPKRIIIVDDGSTDEYSLNVLKTIEEDSSLSIPVIINYQQNGGVSSARNAGWSYVNILDTKSQIFLCCTSS